MYTWLFHKPRFRLGSIRPQHTVYIAFSVSNKAVLGHVRKALHHAWWLHIIRIYRIGGQTMAPAPPLGCSHKPVYPKHKAKKHMFSLVILDLIPQTLYNPSRIVSIFSSESLCLLAGQGASAALRL